MLTSTGSPSSAQLPTYGIDPLWQLHEDSKSTNRSGDLSDIIFNLGHRAALPTTSSIANSFSPSLPRSKPITIPSFASRVDLSCNTWEDLVSTSSSSSQLSPLPGATNLSSSNSFEKRGADAVHSKIRSFQLPKRQRSLESGSRQIYGYYKPSAEALAQMKEMIYRAAVMRPVNLGREIVEEKPKRRNVRISNDPQTTAARQRRERLSERLRVLQRLVPGGTKMDTATMLDEAANYLKYLKSQITIMERVGNGAVDAKLSSLSVKESLLGVEI